MNLLLHPMGRLMEYPHLYMDCQFLCQSQLRDARHRGIMESGCFFLDPHLRDVTGWRVYRDLSKGCGHESMVRINRLIYIFKI